MAALRLAAGGTVAQAALESETGERTLSRWLAEDPSFVALVDRLRGEIISRACGLMADGLVAAGDKLRQHLNHEDARISLRAAVAIHELALDLKHAADDSRRLDELERRLMAQPEKEEP